MAPSRLSRLGRLFVRLVAQKSKEAVNKETFRLASIVEKRTNEQNSKIAHLKIRKDLLEQKLDRGGKNHKRAEELHTASIRVEGNRLLFKYLKGGMFVLAIGTGFLGGRFYERM